MSEFVLALNAGSSSVKFALFAREGDARRAVMRGALEDRGRTPSLAVRDAAGRTLVERRWREGAAPDDLLRETLDWLEGHIARGAVAGVGHRIVHGGLDFVAPRALDDATLDALERLTPLAPLHQPRCLDPVRLLRAHRPEWPQVGCFDTAFHATIGGPASLYALPRRFRDEGVRKYGFHGLSYEYIATHLGALDPALRSKRTLVAHLGSGASLCAMREGRSLDTTMGFSALDGLVMATRTGAIDPGIIFYLSRVHKLDVAEIERLFYHDCGLLGVSGVSGDVRELEASPLADAAVALELFAFRAAREAAALAVSLGGLELLVFTGGVGEHSARVREAVCRRLGFLGVKLDRARNAAGEALIGAPGAGVDVRVIATDEESVIARHVDALLRTRGTGGPGGS